MAPRVPNDPKTATQAPVAPQVGEIIDTPVGPARVVDQFGTITTAIHATHLFPAALIEANRSGRTVVECEIELRKRLGFAALDEARIAERKAEEAQAPEASVVPFEE